MKQINISGLEEKLFYEKLNNGLEVFLFPVSNKSNYYFSFNIKYGNLYQDYKIDNQKVKIPSGVAHFLEHKLFERKDIIHPFKFYAKTGTDVNAATSIYYTSYYCTGNNKLKDNLNYLLSWITKLEVDDAKVEKEKGIIIQESRMHSDNPARLIYEKLKENVFVKDHYGNKVIGEENDILSITKEDLITSYNSFYRPDNMFIVGVGNFNENEILNLIKDKLKDFKNPNQKVSIINKNEPLKVRKEEEIIEMNISIPRMGLGYKQELDDFGIDRHKLDIYISMILKLGFGKTSIFFEEGLKNSLFEDFDYGVEITYDKTFINFFAITNKLNELVKEIENSLRNLKINKEDIERAKKVWIANEIKGYDNISVIANTILRDVVFSNHFLENEIDIIKSINYKDIMAIKKLLNFDNRSLVKIENRIK